MTIAIIIRDICQTKDDESALEAVVWGSEAGWRRAAVVCSIGDGAEPGAVPCPDWSAVCERRSAREIRTWRRAPEAARRVPGPGPGQGQGLRLWGLEQGPASCSQAGAFNRCEPRPGAQGWVCLRVKHGSLPAAWELCGGELQAIKARVQEMEKEAGGMRELQLEAESSLAGNLEAADLHQQDQATLVPEDAFSEEICYKTEVDQRSIYVSNVDYGATTEELESFFSCCGKINRVTIICDRFSGHPKGYAYIEFEEQSSMKAAMTLNESLFRGRVIKVLPKRTNLPGISTPNRGGYQGQFQACTGLAYWGSYCGK
ncbi:embryonic polyadenylate-binding protein 2 [Lathamus discolor]|uniref:embryonic polyadenylate-binding protein 2 n=1 Tax=Lathamus discolor TaxID=678569 RepID=UPI0032B7F88F